jgi:hypothetical protein
MRRKDKGKRGGEKVKQSESNRKIAIRAIKNTVKKTVELPPIQIWISVKNHM